MNARKPATMFAFAALAAAACPLAEASGLVGQQVVATFSNPILAGTIANDPIAGQNTYLDNTATADYSINNGLINNNIVSSNINWGQYSGTNTGFLPDSVLVFVGNSIPGNASTTPFAIGSLTYLNGTSDLSSLIFGVTMNFYAGSVNSANFLGSDNVVITTTNNVFGVPGGLTNGDDDYVNVCGPLSGICGTSIEAVESSEGGSGITVNLSGTIVGDPTLNLSSVALASGQNSTTNGFLGTDPSIGTQGAPEPGTWAMMACGLLLCCVRAGRRRVRG